MGKALIIAEKPSVAGDIAKALGGFKKSKEHYESERHLLSSAVGHCSNWPCPASRRRAANGRSKSCRSSRRISTSGRSRKRAAALKALAKLIKRKDVDALINACDAGREGELIFRNIVQYTKAKQPIKRLWLQSMTPAAIREGFEQLRDDEEMLPLADAACSRSEADWLVGINGTRAMTLQFKRRLRQNLTVGRVQTPTLAIVVEREEKIREFVPREFLGSHRHVRRRSRRVYTGRWFDEVFKRMSRTDRTKRLLRGLRTS